MSVIPLNATYEIQQWQHLPASGKTALLSFEEGSTGARTN
jgi:hypothetical protein